MYPQKRYIHYHHVPEGMSPLLPLCRVPKGVHPLPASPRVPERGSPKGRPLCRCPCCQPCVTSTQPRSCIVPLEAPSATMSPQRDFPAASLCPHCWPIPVVLTPTPAACGDAPLCHPFGPKPLCPQAPSSRCPNPLCAAPLSAALHLIRPTLEGAGGGMQIRLIRA